MKTGQESGPVSGATDDLIVVENVSKSYRGAKVRALNQVSLTIKEGECFGLIGPNGAGKTTLMGCMLALIRPDEGQITIGGVPPDDMAVREIIGFLPERPNFESWVTGREFVAYHAMLSRAHQTARRERVEEVLTQVGLDHQAWDRRTQTYSRGMLQRLGLAQAIIAEPRILFLDEPGSGMDPPGNAMLRKLFMDFKKAGITVVLNSHHLDEMERVCDRVAFIQKGTITSIQTLEKSHEKEHVLHLKWPAENGRDNWPEKLMALAQQTSTDLVEWSDEHARFKVENADAAARVIKEAVMAGIPVQSATPEFVSLAELFEDVHGASE
ncbi:MAG TPA: ABC transporter ATP-binding protein [Candidatus Obscuribacterales bacterium]